MAARGARVEEGRSGLALGLSSLQYHVHIVLVVDCDLGQALHDAGALVGAVLEETQLGRVVRGAEQVEQLLVVQLEERNLRWRYVTSNSGTSSCGLPSSSTPALAR